MLGGDVRTDSGLFFILVRMKDPREFNSRDLQVGAAKTLLSCEDEL